MQFVTRRLKKERPTVENWQQGLLTEKLINRRSPDQRLDKFLKITSPFNLLIISLMSYQVMSWTSHASPCE